MIRKLTNFNLQFNFSILNGLKIRDDVLYLKIAINRVTTILYNCFFSETRTCPADCCARLLLWPVLLPAAWQPAAAARLAPSC